MNYLKKWFEWMIQWLAMNTSLVSLLDESAFLNESLEWMIQWQRKIKQLLFATNVFNYGYLKCDLLFFDCFHRYRTHFSAIIFGQHSKPHFKQEPNFHLAHTVVDCKGEDTFIYCLVNCFEGEFQLFQWESTWTGILIMWIPIESHHT